MNSISPWTAGVDSTINENQPKPLFERNAGMYKLKVIVLSDTVWASIAWFNGSVIFRTAYCPSGFTLEKSEEKGNGIFIRLISPIGLMKVHISFMPGEFPILRYTCSLTPSTLLEIPFWPRDIVFSAKEGRTANTSGKIHVKQVGTRSGLLYLSMTKPKSGSLMYMQNLTALGDYCQQTQTSCAEVVGGKWPELGFALPPTNGKPLQPHVEVTISDAFVAFDATVPDNDHTVTRLYLNMLAALYLEFPRPETIYNDWPRFLEKGLNDLINSHGCWSHINGDTYLNAYLCDYTTPPEIMVQLAVLLPLLDYVEWKGDKLEVMARLKKLLPAFYDDELKTLVRWLPAATNRLKGDEEQKQPFVMDSWYLHHPLLNLSRLALKGDQVASQLFLGSLEFAIKVAHHFKYNWPVFYHMKTLEVVKAETQPGNGGEKDVPGLFAHIMLQAWELTQDKRYLREAERAAKKLVGVGFDLFYQANNTAFSAGALLRLWKITGKKLYLDLSYTCLANVFRNVRLWDCNYGYGQHFPSFFALFPLNDAPYTAVYEEQEVFCAFHDYLEHAQGQEILPAVKLLTSEYIRYLVNRAVYYYPPKLPKEMLEEHSKMGEVNADLWIALEDLHDGWEKSGSVGQEVYGAGNAFGILPRHYYKIPVMDMLLYTDYPLVNFSFSKRTGVKFYLNGDQRISCRVMIIKNRQEESWPEITISIKHHTTAPEISVTDSHMEFSAYGGDQILIRFGG